MSSGRTPGQGGSDDEATKRTARRSLSLIAFLIAIAAVLGWWDSESGTVTRAAPLPPKQVLLQSSIVNDRKHLFKGVLTYQPLGSIAVEDPQRFQVTLFAVGQSAKHTKIPSGTIVGSRSLRVGGVEEAKLSSASDKVTISPIGSTRRLIGRPGDKVQWAWNITPKEPGDYTLDLVIITYQGTTENPLYIVNPPIAIQFEATNTLSHFLSSVKAWIIGTSAFLLAVGGVLALFREQLFGKKDGHGGSSTSQP